MEASQQASHTTTSSSKADDAALLEQLHAARTRYLQQQGLVHELRQLLQGAQAAGLQHASSTGDDSAQEQQPAHTALPAEAAASLARHMQAALLLQHLQLPDGAVVAADGSSFGGAARKAAASAAVSAAPADDTAADAGGQDQLGSRRHGLGVTPQQLRQHFLPSRRAAQKVHAPLLPHLEVRLQQQAAAAAAAVTGVHADEQGPDAGQQALAAVEGKQAALRRLQAANAQALAALLQEALGYLADLDAMHALLQQLVGVCMLQEQPKLDQVALRQKEANLQQLSSKLQAMQACIRAEAYTQRNVAALTAIRRELQQVGQELQAGIQQVAGELHAYTQLGDDFHAIVQEYGDVQAKARELDRVFAQFACIEDEAAAVFG